MGEGQWTEVWAEEEKDTREQASLIDRWTKGGTVDAADPARGPCNHPPEAPLHKGQTEGQPSPTHHLAQKTQSQGRARGAGKRAAQGTGRRDLKAAHDWYRLCRAREGQQSPGQTQVHSYDNGSNCAPNRALPAGPQRTPGLQVPMK